MTNQLWSWLLGTVGLVGFFLAGRRVWWSWYINIANQVLWVAYSVITEQLGFLVTAFFYGAVFVNNAHKWTRAHIESKETMIARHDSVDRFYIRHTDLQTVENGTAYFGPFEDYEMEARLNDHFADALTQVGTVEEVVMNDAQARRVAPNTRQFWITQAKECEDFAKSSE